MSEILYTPTLSWYAATDACYNADMTENHWLHGFDYNVYPDGDW